LKETFFRRLNYLRSLYANPATVSTLTFYKPFNNLYPLMR